MLVNLVVGLLVLGVALYLINTYVPLAPPIRALINIVVVLVALLWVLKALGLLTGTGLL